MLFSKVKINWYSRKLILSVQILKMLVITFTAKCDYFNLGLGAKLIIIMLQLSNEE